MEQEEILWEGKPKQGFQLVFEDLMIIPFIFFFGTVVYLIVGNRINSAAGIFISIVAMLIIIYIRYIRNSIERQSVTYQITSKKVIIRKPYEEIMLPFSSIDKLSFKEHPFTYTYGSVIFGEEENIFGPTDVPYRFGAQGGLNLERDKVAIDFIKDYKEVYYLIRAKMEEQKSKNG